MSYPLMIVYTDSQGREWRYKRNATRIYCFPSHNSHAIVDEINVWDHVNGRPDFDCLEQTGLRDRVLRYLRESEQVEPAGTLSKDGRWQSDGFGCVERVSSVERDWLDPAAHNPRGY